jgi:ATP-dependent protease ClpP protease subunit
MAWYEISAKADDPRRAEVRLYEEIDHAGWWGVSAAQFASEIAALEVDVIDLRINSAGGSAWDGVAIMNALRRHPARVEVTVDGIAASAASLVCMAGDSVVMARSAQMMVHDAIGGAYGNAQTMRDTADVLDKLCDSYADSYAARAGGDRAAWREVMRAETWYTAEEAVLAGLADAWDGSDTAEAAARPVDVSRFRYPGRAAAPAPAAIMAAHVSPASPEPGSTQKKEEDAMSYESLTAGLRERLGITDATIDEDGLLAALDESLTEHAETPTLPEGVVAIEQSVLDVLRSDASAGRAARDEQDDQRRARTVEAAIQDGRVPSSRRQHWIDALKADEEGASATLASLAKGLIPVAEMGNATEPDDDAYPAHWKR